jgi:hypothetical protein
MGFDIKTAKVISSGGGSGFDISTARPLGSKEAKTEEINRDATIIPTLSAGMIGAQGSSFKEEGAWPALTGALNELTGGAIQNPKSFARGGVVGANIAAGEDLIGSLLGKKDRDVGFYQPKTFGGAVSQAGAGVAASFGLGSIGSNIPSVGKGRFQHPTIESLEEMATMAQREFSDAKLLRNASRDAETSLIKKLYSDRILESKNEIETTKDIVKQKAFDLQTQGKERWFDFHKKLNDEFGMRRDALVDEAGKKTDKFSRDEIVSAYKKTIEENGLDRIDDALLSPKQKTILSQYDDLQNKEDFWKNISTANGIDSKVRELRKGLRGKQYDADMRLQSDLAHNLDGLLTDKVKGLRELRAEFKDRYKFKNEAWKIFNPAKETVLDRTSYGMFQRIGEGRGTPQDIEFLGKLNKYFGEDFVKPVTSEAKKLTSISERIAGIEANLEVDLADYGRRALGEEMRLTDEYRNLLDTIEATAKNKKSQDSIRDFILGTSADILTGGHIGMARRAAKHL